MPPRFIKSSVGFAVAGIGHIAQAAVLPAFAHTNGEARLVAIVSGDPRKREVLGDRDATVPIGDAPVDLFARRIAGIVGHAGRSF